MSQWDAKLYLRFAEERTQPAIDLLARIAVEQPCRVVDVGCGPGNSTALLRVRWPSADLIGLDNSPEMIAAAAKDFPDGKWIVADASAWTDSAVFDVIFSNAAVQWVPRHDALLPRLFEMVAPAGALAVQMPRHIHSPVHQLMLEISDRPEWRHLMGKARTAVVVQVPAFYYDLLQPLAVRIDLWETEYLHVMDNPAAILAWIRGTGLRPFLQALEADEQRRRFEELLLAGLEQAYPRRAGGRVLFPFRRLFFVAYRPAAA